MNAYAFRMPIASSACNLLSAGGNKDLGISFSERKLMNPKYRTARGFREMCSNEISHVVVIGFLMPL